VCVDENGFVLAEDQCRGARIERRGRPNGRTHSAAIGFFRRGENLKFSAGDMLDDSSHVNSIGIEGRFPEALRCASVDLIAWTQRLFHVGSRRRSNVSNAQRAAAH
jgi:hypothetical protein